MDQPSSSSVITLSPDAQRQNFLWNKLSDYEQRIVALSKRNFISDIEADQVRKLLIDAKMKAALLQPLLLIGAIDAAERQQQLATTIEGYSLEVFANAWAVINGYNTNGAGSVASEGGSA